MNVDGILEGGNGRFEASVAGDLTSCEADRNFEPCEERDGSIISRGLGCRGIPDIQKSGNISIDMGQKRREGCTSMFIVKRENVGRWVVKKFVKDHNHPLVVSLPKTRPIFDERDKKIQDLTAELRLKKRLSAAYREQLSTLIKDVENHSDHITTKVQVIRNNLKELEARKQKLLDQEKTDS